MLRFPVLVALFTSVFLGSYTSAQQLIINELSQGSGGSKEFVELVVAGTLTCTETCLDMRQMVLDDNNGYFSASSSSAGVAAGAIRFANIPFWQCIPVGTVIVIYNDDDENLALPADDLSMTDGNFTLVIPVSSSLIEGHNTLPSSSNTSYSTTGWVSGGNWTSVGMSNGGDSFQILQNLTSNTPNHGVSYGNNSVNNIIYFTGGQSGKVIFFDNTTSNDPFSQSNWRNEQAVTFDSPGQGNSPNNQAWIDGLRNGTISNNIQLTFATVNTGCSAPCTGSATVTATGGQAPYTYEWSNNATTQSINALCANTYTVEVTDAAGCTQTGQATISNPANMTITFAATNETCADLCDGAITAQVTGGTAPYAYAWTNNQTTASLSDLCDGNYELTITDAQGCIVTASQTIAAGITPVQPTITPVANQLLNGATIALSASIPNGTWSGNGVTGSSFNPASAGVGTHQICYSVNTGGCPASNCITIIVEGPCTPVTSSENITVCPGSSIQVNGQTINLAGSYDVVTPLLTGCDSTHTINFGFYNISPINETKTICQGDSVEVDGMFYSNEGPINFPSVDSNGCTLSNTITISLSTCEIEEYHVFIPNTFTPNNDNVNDVFSISIIGGELYRGFIVNRWGGIVKEFAKDDLIWDGTTDAGAMSPDGVYTYVVTVQKKGGHRFDYHGFVTLIR